ncbi:MAG: BlaI/MecI/CopY family transcriptional regulator [Candidatus Sumerlaeia bacterium]|nr:BlaI/MecI/CopY family transcriptional regulator [Candidatus Sumerlaeia bacterium]
MPETPNPGQPLPALSPAEWDTMEVLWTRGALAARDVHAAVGPGRDWTIQTVKTLLSRLVAKGALDYEQVGNSYLYRPAVRREQLARAESEEFLGRVFRGEALPAIATFIESGKLDRSEIQRLRGLLDELEESAREERQP